MIEKKESTKQFSERLKTLVPTGSGRDFAKRAGIGYSTVHNYLQGISSPTLENLVLLARAGNVSVEWLATGQQSSLVSADPGVVSVPFIDQHNETLKLDTKLLEMKDLHSLLAIRITTDVMHPTFFPGAVLLVDSSDKRLTENKLVVLHQNGNYLFKRVQVLLDGVRLLSDNANYPSIAVTTDNTGSINIVGTIVMIINEIN